MSSRRSPRVGAVAVWWQAAAVDTVIAAVLGAAVAGIFALLGVGLAQRHETAQAERQERQQRHAWLRDDAARSYEHRRQAYSEYMCQWRRHADMAFHHQVIDRSGPDPDFDWLDDLYEAFTAVQVFGTRDAVTGAGVAMRAVDTYAQGSGEPDLDWDVIEPFRREVRRDLAIPDDPVLVED